MGNRHKGRELAFQVLFQMDQGKQSLDDVFANFLAGVKGDRDMVFFAKDLSRGAWEHKKESDDSLGKLSVNWGVDRFASVDRAILRLGAFELLHCPEIPFEVTLNECVELAKEYGTDDSAKFVNGVLDQLRITRHPEKTEPVKPVRADGKDHHKPKKEKNHADL